MLKIEKDVKMAKNIQILPIAVAIGLSIILLIKTCTALVGVGQKGVLEQFGKVSNNVLQSGINLKLPFQSVHIMNIKRQKSEDYQMQNVYNVDQQNVTVDFQVIYSLPSSDKELIYIYKNYNGDPYANFALARIKEAIKTITGQYTTIDMVTRSDEFKTRVIAEAQKNIGDILTINDIIIPNITFDKEIEAAIKQKQVQQQEAEQKKYELIKAQQDAQITLTKAKANAESLRIQANAIAKNPSIVRLKEIEKWDGKFPLNAKVIGSGATIVDSK